MKKKMDCEMETGLHKGFGSYMRFPPANMNVSTPSLNSPQTIYSIPPWERRILVGLGF